MIAGLESVAAQWQVALWHVFVVFLRVGAVASLFPGVGDRTVPLRVKLAIGMAFSVAIAPAVDRFAMSDLLIQNLKYLLSEPVTGLLIGIGVRMFVFALQVAGSMAAQAMSLSQVLGGAGEEPLPAIGYVLTTAGVALAFVLDLHVKASVMLISSFQIIPPGSFLPAADLSQWGVGQVVSGFSLAFRMAAPFLLVAMLYNLMLGVINRAMPQLMVAFVGAPLITFGGLALLFASSAGVLALWNAEFTHFLSDPFGSRP